MQKECNFKKRLSFKVFRHHPLLRGRQRVLLGVDVPAAQLDGMLVQRVESVGGEHPSCTGEPVRGADVQVWQAQTLGVVAALHGVPAAVDSLLQLPLGSCPTAHSLYICF